MTEERMDFISSSLEKKANISHFVGHSKKIPTEREAAEKSGPVKILNPPNLPTLAGRIRYCMRGKTFAEFAKTIGACGPTVSRWANGKAIPRSRVMAKIAEVGGVPLEWLEGEAQNENKKEPEIPKEAAKEKRRKPSLSISVNGVYKGKDLARLLSGLEPDGDFFVEMKLEGESDGQS